MKTIALFVMLSMSYSVMAYANADVFSELVKIETASDMCTSIISTNKLIQLGESAVDPLIMVLGSTSYGHKAKWSAVMALGEIGNPRALPILSAIAQANGRQSYQYWLGDLSREAIAKIKGEIPKQGKFRLMTVGVQTTVTDCESGKDEIRH